MVVNELRCEQSFVSSASLAPSPSVPSPRPHEREKKEADLTPHKGWKGEEHLGKKEKKAPQRKKEEEEEDEEERGESTRRRETRSREKRRSFEKNLLRRSRYTLVMYAPTPQYEKGKSIWGRKKKKKEPT